MTGKIYTKTGDAGETGLFGGPRLRKDNARIEAYGAVDELNSVLGVARAAGPAAKVDEVLASVQHELFALGAELATPDPEKHKTNFVQPGHVERLEEAIDRFEERLAPLSEFILPGGTPQAAALHHARTVCRRAERRAVTLVHSGQGRVSPLCVQYLNRLGDLLFVLARAENMGAGVADMAWQKPAAEQS
jgi:cob(I)alamin adenosyltransferase